MSVFKVLILRLRCFDTVFQRPYRYFSIVLKVVFSLSNRYKIFTSDWLWIEICENVVLSKMETSLKKWIRVLSITVAIIPTRFLCQMLANSSEAKFLKTISKFRKRKKISSDLVYVLHKTCNYAFSHRSRSVTVKKCTQKRGALAELLFCVFNLLPF